MAFVIFLLIPYIMYPQVIIHTENNRNLNGKSDRFDRSINLVTFIMWLSKSIYLWISAVFFSLYTSFPIDNIMNSILWYLCAGSLCRPNWNIEPAACDWLAEEENCIACYPVSPSPGDNQTQQRVESSRNSFISLLHATYRAHIHKSQKKQNENLPITSAVMSAWVAAPIAPNGYHEGIRDFISSYHIFNSNHFLFVNKSSLLLSCTPSVPSWLGIFFCGLCDITVFEFCTFF